MPDIVSTLTSNKDVARLTTRWSTEVGVEGDVGQQCILLARINDGGGTSSMEP
jgi:hypothetical protein